ncbi:MAG: hypothetical protein KDK36_20230, partial [Leptospiraceae bacterium]|nr:hypothetical protein [Leptospiraceae bacterium]
MAFVKAEREKAYLRLGLSGVTGSGKTYSSLLLGTKIASLTNTRVGLIDSEQRSSLFYAERKKGGQLVGFDFDHSELNSSDPLEYVNEIKAAKAAGYGVLII